MCTFYIVCTEKAKNMKKKKQSSRKTSAGSIKCFMLQKALRSIDILDTRAWHWSTTKKSGNQVKVMVKFALGMRSAEVQKKSFAWNLESPVLPIPKSAFTTPAGQTPEVKPRRGSHQRPNSVELCLFTDAHYG